MHFPMGEWPSPAHGSLQALNRSHPPRTGAQIQMISLKTTTIDPNPIEEIVGVALHEAAHAVIAIHYGRKILEISASVNPPGYTQSEPFHFNVRSRPTKREIKYFTHSATIALAGPVMQARTRLVAQGHFSEDEKTLSLISGYFRLHKIKLDLEKCEETATRLVRLHKSAITTLAQALLEKPILSGEEVHAIVKLA
jgi:hypothetical protein